MTKIKNNNIKTGFILIQTAEFWRLSPLTAWRLQIQTLFFFQFTYCFKMRRTVLSQRDLTKRRSHYVNTFFSEAKTNEGILVM